MQWLVYSVFSCGGDSVEFDAHFVHEHPRLMQELGNLLQVRITHGDITNLSIPLIKHIPHMLARVRTPLGATVGTPRVGHIDHTPRTAVRGATPPAGGPRSNATTVEANHANSGSPCGNGRCASLSNVDLCIPVLYVHACCVFALERTSQTPPRRG